MEIELCLLMQFPTFEGLVIFSESSSQVSTNSSGRMELLKFMMEVHKGTCILISIIFVTKFWETEGQELFFTDFLKSFNNENPVFISRDEFEEDFRITNMENSATALIRYTTNEDEEEVAGHLQKLLLLGDLTMLVFIDNGHHKLLDLLINDLQLFKTGLTGLISEVDVTTGLNLTLRLDTRLYLYTSVGETIHLKEIYAVNKETKLQTVGTWKPNTGLTITTKNMWERRMNLERMMIQVATISWPLLQEVQYDESGKSIIWGSGLFLEPLNILAKRLNFTLKLMDSIDGKWGALDSDGTWNGLIGMLIKDQADIVGAAISWTEARCSVVTCGTAFSKQVMTLVSSSSNIESEANPWIYVEIFPHGAWYVCCAVIMSISTCFAVINYSGINYMHGKFDSENFTILNGLGLSLTFFRLIYYDVNINCKSTRILFFLSAVSTYLLYIHYTAFLTASSTYDPKIQINSFRDVISGGYQIVVMENTAQHDLLRYSKQGTAMNEVYKKTMENRPGAFIKSLDKVQKMLSSKKTLLYESELNLKALYGDLTYLNIQGLHDVNCYKRYIIYHHLNIY